MKRGANYVLQLAPLEYTETDEIKKGSSYSPLSGDTVGDTQPTGEYDKDSGLYLTACLAAWG